jgi:antitoxin MazE
MRVTVQKWGNSLALRIPRAFAREVKVAEGAIIDLSVAKGKLVAAPVRKKRTLRQMVAKINNGNLHDEVDFGPPQGREIW